VWETFGDADGQTTAFVDGRFAPPRAAGGDFVALDAPEQETY
jgi:hypothetical protein